MKAFNSNAPQFAIDAYERSKSMRPYKLDDFHNTRLTEHGFLRLDKERAFSNTSVLIDVKAALLELSRVKIDTESTRQDPTVTAPASAYILRNLTGGPEASVLFDDQLVDNGHGIHTQLSESGKEVFIPLFEGVKYPFGSVATPELELSSLVDPTHFYIAFDTSGTLHIGDNYSNLGTDVYTEESYGAVRDVCHTLHISGYRTLTKAAAQGEWPLRPRPPILDITEL